MIPALAGHRGGRACWWCRWCGRSGPGFVVAGGLALSAAGYSLVAFGDHSAGPALLLGALLILALGVGAAETISNDLILGAVPPEKSGAAAAISETGYEVGSLLGTAVLGSILTASYQHNLRVARRASPRPPPAEAAHRRPAKPWPAPWSWRQPCRRRWRRRSRQRPARPSIPACTSLRRLRWY